MKSITIRGIDPELGEAIKQYASSSQQSINQWIIQMLKQVTGISKKPVFKKYYDLDLLAGGWTDEETEHFVLNTLEFGQIDTDIWK
ncbi:MAG: toxin-antitoxin system HicB family antitoxin [Leptospiraceae bacterium]|nr:toxin-antitoxin system HicB family antitoxin [Leptospiraceae bacterium]MCP5493318.1 toxin-antitoxin system HicB family antitoxin [Leptospiraceae bacterium]